MRLNLLTVYGNLATMLEAGVDIRRAVESSVGDGRGRLPDAMMDVQTRISAGEALTDAMANHPRVFPHADLMLIRVGEEAGRLPHAFKELNDWYTFRRKLWRSMISGLIYPSLVIHVAAVVIPLPKLITGAIGFGAFLLTLFFILACFYTPLIAMYFTYRLSSGRSPLRTTLDFVLGKTPVIGRAIRDLAIARYCRSFLALYEAGIPVQRCCEAAVDMCGNAMVASWFAGAVKQVKIGDPIYLGFSRHLPYEFCVVWQNGEEGGRLAFAVGKLAEDYSEFAQQGFARISTWLPRLVYLVIALFIIHAIFKIAVELSSFYQM